jgi:hypothetical protein
VSQTGLYLGSRRSWQCSKNLPVVGSKTNSAWQKNAKFVISVEDMDFARHKPANPIGPFGDRDEAVGVGT